MQVFMDHVISMVYPHCNSLCVREVPPIPLGGLVNSPPSQPSNNRLSGGTPSRYFFHSLKLAAEFRAEEKLCLMLPLQLSSEYIQCPSSRWYTSRYFSLAEEISKRKLAFFDFWTKLTPTNDYLAEPSPPASYALWLCVGIFSTHMNTNGRGWICTKRRNWHVCKKMESNLPREKVEWYRNRCMQIHFKQTTVYLLSVRGSLSVISWRRHITASVECNDSQAITKYWAILVNKGLKAILYNQKPHMFHLYTKLRHI